MENIWAKVTQCPFSYGKEGKMTNQIINWETNK